MDNPSIADDPSHLRVNVVFEVWSKAPGEFVWRRWQSHQRSSEDAFDYIARERGRFPKGTLWKVYRIVHTLEREEVSHLHHLR